MCLDTFKKPGGSRRIFCNTCKTTRRRELDKIKKRKEREKPGFKEAYRSYILMKNYGITSEQWHRMFDAQGNICAICKAKEPKWSKGWHTDHDHTTGKVRGILCHKCNLMIGLAKDDSSILLAAVKYLEE